MQDGLTESLASYIQSLEGLGDTAKAIAKNIIDEEASDVISSITQNVPVRTGGLKAHIRTSKEQGGAWYGHIIEFEGNAPNGEPYEKIANVLNYGTKHKAGTHFISRPVHKLKGMDERIRARIQAEIDKHAE